MSVIDSGRTRLEDKIFDSDLENESFHNYLFVRIGSKKQKFVGVDFSHTYFEHCYFRNIIFEDCNFNGCKFINCNFTQSTFPGSKFEYAIFEKTLIEDEILSNNCPSYDNLIQKFARSLRLNYQSLGEAVSANKAIKIELKATKNHLYDAWNSNKTYYRTKYGNWKSWERWEMFFKWLNFKIHEFVWGNGENVRKLILTGIYLWIVCTLIHTFCFKNSSLIISYWESFKEVPSIIWGVRKPDYYSANYLTFLTILRFLGFALFTSIIIKRFNRR
ncbi:hypothetical protein C7S20_09190 [Christiangramia fulva]|uniref:Pentapeptide repeat-containing protein n=1 Tax=Christiangramia fulva TaxID=2126553 RepID=A0A2R3Z587_9FLAO|nr:pentapeptide repeat-containing protein [Christiangramia fulva]AVR45430.1 hypothetical protein C7S20_09190 [Christiangramia fulva]